MRNHGRRHLRHQPPQGPQRMSKPFTPQFQAGDTVIYRGQTDDQRNWGSNDDAELVLVRGQHYTVEKVEVHSWHTKISVFGAQGRFNSVCFALSSPTDL